MIWHSLAWTLDFLPPAGCFFFFFGCLLSQTCSRAENVRMLRRCTHQQQNDFLSGWTSSGPHHHGLVSTQELNFPSGMRREGDGEDDGKSDAIWSKKAEQNCVCFLMFFWVLGLGLWASLSVWWIPPHNTELLASCEVNVPTSRLCVIE